MLEDLYPYTPPAKLSKPRKLLSKDGIYETTSDLFNMVYSWMVDDTQYLVTRFDGFDLYRMIARKIHKAIPIVQMKQSIFEQFQINCQHEPSTGVPSNQWIYKL